MQNKANLQDIFLTKARRERVPVTLFLMNGFQLRGILTGFDAFVVVLDVKAITDGDIIDVGGQKLVARSPGPPAAPGEFAVGATPEATAINIEMAATDPAWPGSKLRACA